MTYALILGLLSVVTVWCAALLLSYGGGWITDYLDARAERKRQRDEDERRARMQASCHVWLVKR